MDTILKAENLNVYYGSIHAIKDVSFEVKEGEIVTLIGANGAGKSTTLNTVSGPAPAPSWASPLPTSRPTRSWRWAWPRSPRDGGSSCR